jgi:secretion/DNA translocation related CpaE-like protein
VYVPNAAHAAGPHRPLVVTASPVLLDHLVRLVAAAGGEADVAVDAVAARPLWSRASVVLVGEDVTADVGSAGLPRRPGVVLAGIDRAQPETYVGAVQVGAEEVVVLPDAEEWLVRRIADALEGDATTAFVLATLGGRGGGGASTLAVALALAARRQHRSTVLIDADQFGGGLDLVLGGEETPGLRWSGLTQARGRVSSTALDALPRMRDVPVLSFDRTEVREVTDAAMQAVLSAACRAHELVVVDLPRRVDALTRVVLDRADLTLLVVPAEVRATAAAARLVAVVGLVAADLRIVVRRPAPSGLEAPLIAGALGLPLAGDLRAEPGIAGALERGEPPGRRGRGPLASFCSTILDQLLPAAGRAAAA